MKLKISHQLDAKFKEIAAGMPPVQIEIKGIRQTIKGKPLYVNHHAEILCHYAKNGQKGVEKYVKQIHDKFIALKAKQESKK